MSAWKVANIATRCTSLGCPALILPSEVFREVGPRRLAVCAGCCQRRFEMAAPATVPVPDHSSPAGTVFRFGAVSDMARDYKVAQMAREPGEDDV